MIHGYTGRHAWARLRTWPLLLIAALAVASAACQNDNPGDCCAGRECGVDPTCGATCGECADGDYCSSEGMCECEPDCSGRQCGPDPNCGVSCGSCGDSNTCTAEVCTSAGTCQYDPVTNGVTGCRDWLHADVCINGSASALNCATTCLDADYNATYGCDDSRDLCICTDISSSCVVGERYCATANGADYLVMCLEGNEYGTPSDFWYIGSCDDICQSAGYAVYLECGPSSDGQDSCFCCNPSCAGKECGDDGCGGSCGYCSGSDVCSNGQCVRDPCQECTSSCQGLPSCCTGCGCICEEECGGSCTFP